MPIINITKMGDMGENNNINILYNNMSFRPPYRLIRIRNGRISLANQRVLRQENNIQFRGRTRVQQRLALMNTARDIRNNGRNFRNETFAYRYLARLSNQQREQLNQDARNEFVARQTTLQEFRTAIDRFIIDNELQVYFTINQQRIQQLSMNTILRTLGERIGNRRVVLQVNFDSGVERFFTFNQTNITFLLEQLDAYELNEGGVLQGSDVEWLVDIDSIESIVIRKVELASLNNKEVGGFFKSLNLTPFNLEKYGIYEKCEPHNYLENCLIKALKAAEIPQKKIDSVKGHIFNREVPICKLGIVADIIECNIRLRKTDNCKKSNIYGSSTYKREISIGLVDSHYFYVDNCDFTSYALKNWKVLSKEHENYDDWRTIYKLRNKNGTLYYQKDEKRCISSYQAIKYMQENKDIFLKPIGYDDNIFGTIYHDKGMDFVNENENGLSFEEEHCLKLNNYDQEKTDYATTKCNEYNNVYFDFETSKQKIKDFGIMKEIEIIKKKFFKKKKTGYYINKIASLEKRLWRTIHRPYLCCAKFGDKEKCKSASFSIHAFGDTCGKQILDGICNFFTHNLATHNGTEPNKKIRMIAHNCGFDYRFLMKYLFADNQKTKGNGLMNAKGKYYFNKTMFDFEFKDSYKLITMPLRGFAKCFNLEASKEVFPYNLYNNYKNIEEIWVPIHRAKEELGDRYKQFKTNLVELKMIKKNKSGVDVFNMMDYSLYYCEIDCIVLQQGYETFRKWCLEDEIIKIDVNSVWTIASLANKVLMKHGCFKDVYQVGGRVRHFLQKCVVGGRCCTRDNKKWKTDKKVADLDAVSLYPSAFYRMDGFLKGKPKVIKDSDCREEFINKQDGYFIKIKITKVNKKYHIPCMSFVNKKDGIRNWTNDMVGKICYIDKTTLQDWIRFHKIEYKILTGYYYNDGRNPTIKRVIKSIFDIRLKKKAEKNPIQVVYKLIMNSAYGKTILKPITTSEKIIKGETAFKKFLDRNYNSIIEYHKVYDNRKKAKPKYIFKLQKDIMDHFNNAPVGIECLSMSKRIMFEPMCLAEDMDINIYITDTDSMHIEYDKVKELSKAFGEKYGRVLEGKKLGQLHIDFELKGTVGEVYSIRSIYLGKKCYMDILKGKDKDGNDLYGHHIRMKGIPNTTLYYTAEKLTNIENPEEMLWNMYDKLYEGKMVDFDLLEGGNRCNFKFNGDMTIGYMKEFTRRLSFNTTAGSLFKTLE